MDKVTEHHYWHMIGIIDDHIRQFVSDLVIVIGRKDK